MSQNWIRACQLQVGDGSSALDLSNFRIRFLCTQNMLQSPQRAEIRIYNLSDDTVAKPSAITF
jgi:hypothetical protein